MSASSSCFDHFTTRPCRKSRPPCSSEPSFQTTNGNDKNSDYAAKVFGFATFGRVYGTIIALSGVVNFAQVGIVALTKQTFHNDPIPVNAFLAACGFVIGITIVVFVWFQGRIAMQKQEEEDAMGESQSLMESVLEDESEYGTF